MSERNLAVLCTFWLALSVGEETKTIIIYQYRSVFVHRVSFGLRIHLQGGNNGLLGRRHST